ncbi:UNVERIFIED_CONTAM: hypothetical protein PYX00_002805 [Menopon gallinae]|uniref:Uncharacterized protein n=1 Tax=Menopon gallinae TaxID=328185 RepID=A0AAW2HXV7_9NEOP
MPNDRRTAFSYVQNGISPTSAWIDQHWKNRGTERKRIRHAYDQNSCFSTSVTAAGKTGYRSQQKIILM